jgi:outer membrane autotransporter protein
MPPARFRWVIAVVGILAGADCAFAQSLTAVVESGLYPFNGLELDAAKINDAAYAGLLADCGPAATTAAAATCTGNRLLLFDRLRELEDTANELLGRGETQFSLRLGAQGLGFALRWTADEEYSAQGSATSKFANGQLSALTSRLGALRFASQSLRLARAAEDEDHDDWPSSGEVAQIQSYGTRTLGGGASADSGGLTGSPWGAFANGGYGAGSKAPTTFEDAFDFNDTEASAGADVRLSNRLVVGLMAGSSVKHVIFNSADSIVDGNIRADGYSLLSYVQYEGDHAYVNLSLGGQHLNLDTTRKITYPSLNPLIPSVNETSTSSTAATSWTGTFGTGYTFQHRGFSAEPYLTAQYVNTHISSFTEHGGDGFDFVVGSQSIPSLIGAVGIKLLQAVPTRVGVFVPYVYGQRQREFLDDSRTIQSVYAGSDLSTGAGAAFELPTDRPDRDYYVVGGGVSTVLKHGFQAYVQYMKVLQLQFYSDYVAFGGIRYEF